MPENIVKARMDPTDIDKLEQLARIERTTKSRIIRNAVLDVLDDRLTVCPECEGAEVKEHGEFDKGLCRTVAYLYCADCGHVWES